MSLEVGYFVSNKGPRVTPRREEVQILSLTAAILISFVTPEVLPGLKDFKIEKNNSKNPVNHSIH